MTLAWRGAVVGGVAVLMLILAANVVLPQPWPGVQPQDARTCPLSHPIKGNFTTYSGERCIYHVSGGGFYDKTKPERCYATEAEARLDACRRSKR
jgi:uncharacterized protein (DUF2126 family)